MMGKWDEISIHALREEGDTAAHLHGLIGHSISIHALREEGDHSGQGMFHSSCVISIHALREEGDATTGAWTASGTYFYPRPPRGGRPVDVFIAAALPYFYPRPPRGGRHGDDKDDHSHVIFLSTPSARRATRRPVLCTVRYGGFLSTPSARRATTMFASSMPSILNFYPRPPRGGRPKRSCASLLLFLFLSTPSARRATSRVTIIRCVLPYFYPRPPRGGRRRYLFWGR
mgnify:CR=1 FL=1